MKLMSKLRKIKTVFVTQYYKYVVDFKVLKSTLNIIS